MTYHNAVKYILSAQSDSKAHSAERIKLICRYLGDPQHRLPYVRLAGSNGKSVCQAMLSAVLSDAGLRVGSLVMPASDEPRENILIAGDPMTMDDTVLLVKRIVSALADIRHDIAQQQNAVLSQTETANPAKVPEVFVSGKADVQPTRNEILFLIAMIYFRENNCDICLIECDHNGQDPSTVLPPSACTVICGTVPSKNLSEIHKIKSYIKRGVQEVVSATQDGETYRIISDACAAVNCRLSIPARSTLTVKRLSLKGSEFRYKNVDYSLRVCGKFQIMNAVTVIEAVAMLGRFGYKITRDNIFNGLKSVTPKARFEVISVMPTLIADSTYMLDAVDTMCDSLCDFKEQTGTDVRLCLPPDIPLINRYLSSLSARGYRTTDLIIPMPAADEAGDFNASDFAVPAVTPATFKAAAKYITSHSLRNDLVLISGPASFTGKVRFEILRIMSF